MSKIIIQNEKDLSQFYFSKFKGISYTEVSVGDRKTIKNSNDRRIDIVRIEKGRSKQVLKYGKNKDSFKELVNEKKYKIELIEAKIKLNRTVIGQIIVGEYLFKKKFKVKNVTKAILYHIGDELLEKFCREYGIKLIRLG